MSTATATGPTARLQGRAARLRAQAAAMHPLVASAYRRRAAELDVDALVEAVWNPPIDLSDTLPSGIPVAVAVRRRPGRLAVA